MSGKILALPSDLDRLIPNFKIDFTREGLPGSICPSEQVHAKAASLSSKVADA